MTTTPATGKQAKLVVYQGATYDSVWLFENPDGTPYNLTGLTARMQMRKSWFDDTAIFTLTTENGGITIDADAGTVALYMSEAMTVAFPNDVLEVPGVWDIYLYNNSLDPPEADRYIMGEIVISPWVTHNA